MKRYFLPISILLIALSACSPVYVIKAAYEQAKILNRRTDITEVIQDPQTSEAERRKLKLVQEARIYAKIIGLKPGKSFTKYSRLDTDVLSWILIASKPDKFELYTWWFPIVGSVPYKGYFSRTQAEEAAEKLVADGYEHAIRPAVAFSTLGWFDDPLLSSTLNADEVSVVNTVIHESVHATFWVEDQVEFNESLANFIGTIASCDFFQSRLDSCNTQNPACKPENEKYYRQCIEEMKQEFELAGVVQNLYRELEELYAGRKSRAEKLSARSIIFEKHLAPLQKKYPGMKALQKINNAEIMQIKLYLSGFRELEALYVKSGRHFAGMMEKIQALKKLLEESDSPFSVLNKQ